MKYPISLGDRENSFINIHALKNLINLKIDELVDAAPETLNTLKELADAIEQNGLDDLATKSLLEAALANKADLESILPSLTKDAANGHNYVDFSLPSGLLWKETCEKYAEAPGGKWRVPTKEECQELFANADISMGGSYNDDYYFIITSKTDASISIKWGADFWGSSSSSGLRGTYYTSSKTENNKFLEISLYSSWTAGTVTPSFPQTNNNTGYNAVLYVLDPIQEPTSLHKISVTGDYNDLKNIPNVVTKIGGKGLSTNDYTNNDRISVNELASYDEVNVGDFLYEDLSCSPTLDANKTPIAICVIGTDDLGDGLARFIALNVPNEITQYPSWGTSGVNYNYGLGPGLDIQGVPNYPNTEEGKAQAILDYNGKQYTTIMLSTNANLANLFYEFNPGKTLKGDWYVPSTGELYKVYENINTINSSLTNAGMEALVSRTYYTSNEVNSTEAWKVSLQDGSLSTQLKDMGYGGYGLVFYQTAGERESILEVIRNHIDELETRIAALEAAQ